MSTEPDRDPRFTAFPSKVPFEDRVLAWLTAHPESTVGECSEDLGVGLAAVLLAVASLESKGLVAPDPDDPPDAPGAPR